jgi:hypothetical protein
MTLRFLVLLFDLPAIASRSGEAGGSSYCQLPAVRCQLYLPLPSVV